MVGNELEFDEELHFLKNFSSIINFYARALQQSGKRFFFVQLGASDGRHDDPIHRFVDEYKWDGILVEPQKKQFIELKKQYAEAIANGSQLTFVNTAISKKHEIRDLFRLAGELLGPSQDSSQKKEDPSILGTATLVPQRSELKEAWAQKRKLIKEKIECITMQELYKQHDVSHVDLLQIDVEGYDYELLRTYDFSKIAPVIIQYETRHMTPDEFREIEALLKQHEYLVIHERFDSIAFKNDLFDIKYMVVSGIAEHFMTQESVAQR